MLLTEMYRTAKSLEAIENYSRAGITRGYRNPVRERPSTSFCISDGDFWEAALQGSFPWGSKIELYRFTISEWVPRIPGLFWTKEAARMRELAKSAVEYKSGRWNALEPLGKSQKVLGGIGTLRFPPAGDGYRLVSACAGMNASAGIPVLIPPDVWEFNKLREGRLTERIRGEWQSMAGTGWSERFPSVKDIPKGYLVLKHTGDIDKYHSGDTVPTLFHPFSVMEYSSGNSLLYDFVFASADTGERMHRSYIEEFFEQYKKDNERYGRYLLGADIAQPMWDAEFESPESLTRAETGAKSKLELLQARVNGESFRGRNLESILELLSRNYQKEDLRRLSDDVGIPPGVWFTGGRDADAANDFLAVCLERGKVDALVDAVALEYPESFR